MNDHILKGFSDEIEKNAAIGRVIKRVAGAVGRAVRKRPGLVGYPAAAAGLGAAGLYGAYSIAQREKKKRKAVKKMITGQYRPGAGMIVPPRSY